MEGLLNQDKLQVGLDFLFPNSRSQRDSSARQLRIAKPSEEDGGANGKAQKRLFASGSNPLKGYFGMPNMRAY